MHCFICVYELAFGISPLNLSRKSDSHLSFIFLAAPSCSRNDSVLGAAVVVVVVVIFNFFSKTS